MRRDAATVLDIVLACRRIERYTQPHTRASFFADPIVQDAVLYKLTVIGEAVRRLSPQFCERHEDVPWRQIAGLRNRVIHEYDDIDVGTVWRVVRDEVPVLRRRLEPLAPSEPGNS